MDALLAREDGRDRIDLERLVEAEVACLHSQQGRSAGLRRR